MADINLNFGTEDIKGLEKMLDELRKLVAEIKKNVEKTGTVTMDQATELKRAQAEAMKVTNEYNKQLKAQEARNRKLQEEKGILGGLKAQEAEIRSLRQSSTDPQKIKEYTRQLANLKNQIKAVSGETNRWGTALGSFQFKFNALGNIAADVLKGITMRMKMMVSESIKLGAEIEGVKIAFDRLNNPGLLNDMRKAVNNTVSDLQLMRLAIKANNFKIPINQIAEYMRFLDLRADQTGESLEELSDTFFMAVGKQMPKALGAVGISTERIKAAIKETGDFTIGLGKIIQEEFARGSGQIDKASDSLEQFQATVENLKAGMGTFFWKSILDTEEWSNFFAVMNDSNISGWRKFVMSVSDFSGKQAKDLAESSKKSTDALAWFNQTTNQTTVPIAQIDDLTQSLKEFNDMLNSIDSADFGKLSESAWGDQYEYAQKAFDRILKAQNEFKELYKEVNDEIRDDFMETMQDIADDQAEKTKKQTLQTVEHLDEEEKKFKESKIAELRAYSDFFSGLQAISGQNTIIFKMAAIAEATINMWKAAMSALAEERGGAKKKLAAYAIILATGLKTLASLKSVKVKQYGEGGEINGKPHSQGGTMIEAERGEFVVRKSAYQKNKELIKAINADDSRMIAEALRTDKKIEVKGKDYTKELYEWMKKQPVYGEDKEFFIIHSGNKTIKIHKN